MEILKYPSVYLQVSTAACWGKISVEVASLESPVSRNDISTPTSQHYCSGCGYAVAE